MKKELPPIEIVLWVPATPVVLVRGQSGKEYTINHDIETCTCPDFANRARHRCKHLLFVLPLVPHRAILEAAQAKRFASANKSTSTPNPTKAAP